MPVKSSSTSQGKLGRHPQRSPRMQSGRQRHPQRQLVRKGKERKLSLPSHHPKRRLRQINQRKRRSRRPRRTHQNPLLRQKKAKKAPSATVGKAPESEPGAVPEACQETMPVIVEQLTIYGQPEMNLFSWEPLTGRAHSH